MNDRDDDGNERKERKQFAPSCWEGEQDGNEGNGRGWRRGEQEEGCGRFIAKEQKRGSKRGGREGEGKGRVASQSQPESTLSDLFSLPAPTVRSLVQLSRSSTSVSLCVVLERPTTNDHCISTTESLIPPLDCDLINRVQFVWLLVQSLLHC